MAPAWGSAAASSWVMPSGIGASTVSGTHTYSANPPNWLRRSAYTSSPGWKRVALRPVASTVPATSEPRMCRRGRNGPPMRAYSGLPRSPSQSEALRDTDRTFTSTSSSPGVGVSTSVNRSTSGDPYRV